MGGQNELCLGLPQKGQDYPDGKTAGAIEAVEEGTALGTTLVQMASPLYTPLS